MKTTNKLFTIFVLLALLLAITPLQAAHTAGARYATPATSGAGGRFGLATPDDHTTDGVTIFVHGWNPDMAGTPAWLGSIRNAVAANYLGNEQNYGTITVTKSGGNLVATCSPWNLT